MTTPEYYFGTAQATGEQIDWIKVPGKAYHGVWLANISPTTDEEPKMLHVSRPGKYSGSTSQKLTLALP